MPLGSSAFVGEGGKLVIVTVTRAILGGHCFVFLCKLMQRYYVVTTTPRPRSDPNGGECLPQDVEH